MSPEKSRDLERVSSLQMFMARLCVHHQQQLLHALEFLQREVSNLAACQPSESPATSAASLVTEARVSAPTTQPEVTASWSPAVHTSFVGNIVGSAGSPGVRTKGVEVEKALAAMAVTSDSLACPEDLLPEAASSHMYEPVEVLLLGDEDEGGDRQRSGQACPAKVDLGFGGNADVKKLQVGKSADTLEGHQVHPNVNAWAQYEKHKPFDCLHPAAMTGGSQEDDKDLCQAPLEKVTSKGTLPTPSRRARKSCRGSRSQDLPVCQKISDPECNYDIVYISKSITEIDLERKKCISLRRTARKSTRGYKFVGDCLELRTVRTTSKKLSGIHSEGSYPSPLAKIETCVTPNHMLFKLDGLPPVDGLFAGGCGETAGLKTPVEKPVETESAGDFVAEASNVEPLLETSHTDQLRVRGCSLPFQPEDNVCLVTEITPTEQANARSQIFSSVDKESLQFKERCNDEAGQLVHKHVAIVCSQVMELASGEHQGQCVVGGINNRQDFEKGVEERTPNLQSELTVKEQLQDELLSPNVTVSETVLALRPTEKRFSESQSDSSKGSQLPLENESTCINGSSEMEKRILHQQQPADNVQTNAVVCCSTTNSEHVTEAFEEQGDFVCGNTERRFTSEQDNTVMNSPSDVDVSLGCGGKGGSLEEPAEKSTSETSLTCKEDCNKISCGCLQKQPQLSSCQSTTLDYFGNITLTTPPVIDINSLESTPEESQSSISISAGDVFVSATCSKMVISNAPSDVNPVQSTDARPDDYKVSNCKVQTTENYIGICNGERMDNGSDESIKTMAPVHAEEQEASLLKGVAVQSSSMKGTSEFSVNVAAATGSWGRKEKLLRRESQRIANTTNSRYLSQNKRLVLRSHSSQSLVREKTAENRHAQKRAGCSVKAKLARVFQPQRCDLDPLCLQTVGVSVENSSKFLDELKGEKTQQLIAHLNTRYDRMQKGWIQLDKDGQPIAKPRNKADRLRDIWKSRRRSRRSRFHDGQRHSPVQMLFMKTFDLATVCHWFLQSTETRSLIIMKKKVNTRVPSETRAGYYSSAGAVGSSHVMFSSLQAERLKKHLKKFPVASPAKSNPSSQQLVAKTHVYSGLLGKLGEKTEFKTATRIGYKSNSQPVSSQSQVSASAKLPARSRILRKYSNIREKLQGRRQNIQPGKNVSTKTIPSPKTLSQVKCMSGAEKKATENLEISQVKKTKAQKTPPKKDLTRRGDHSKQAKCRNDKSSVLLTSKDGNVQITPSTRSGKKPQRSNRTSAGVSKSKAEDKKRLNGRQRVFGVQQLGSQKAKSKDPNEQKKDAGCSVVPSQRKVCILSSLSPDQVMTRSQRKMGTLSSGSVSKLARKRTSNVDFDPVPVKMTRKSFLKAESCQVSESELAV